MSGFSSAEATILQSVNDVRLQVSEVCKRLSDLDQLVELKADVLQIKEAIEALTVQKDFYTTREVAELLGVTQHHVQVRLCATSRIECEKDPTTGRWRIPGHEYDRLRRGGKPEPAC